ncbi:MAG: SDR family oxidoreductase [Rhodospirillaceae bacterium]
MSTGNQPGRLFCFGLGYSARALAAELMAAGWRVAGTSRDEAGLATLAGLGIESHRFEAVTPGALAGTTHLLSSVPPDEAGDPVLARHGALLAPLAGTLAWAGYLSTTGVYGDTGGAWVDEAAPLAPSGARQARRIAAERAWLAALPCHVFRLAGIYGPGRSALDQVRAGTAKRIDKPDHLFSRIHVDDISNVLIASFARPNPGAIYNVCDDRPAAPAEVVTEASRLLGVEPPPLQPLVLSALSPMAASFWRDHRRVRNDRIRRELGVVLRHPDYRSGLAACL